MITDKIKRAIDLVKRTGEKMILFEDNSSEGIVIMNLEDYEDLVSGSRSLQEENDKEISDLTEDELIDKINRNIAIWKSQNEDQELDSEKIMDSFLGLSEELDEEEEENTEEDNFYYYPEDKISFSEIAPQEEEEEAQSESEGEKQEETQEQEKQEQEQEQTEQVEQEEIGGKRSNWEIPVNIKRNAEEVEE